MQLDPAKILKDRQNNSTTLSQQIASLNGTKPNIGQTYNRAADTSILASGQRSDRNRANFMAHGGGRMGAAGQLLAGESAAGDMTNAQSQAAGLRAEGAQAQFGAELSIQQLLAQLLGQKAQADEQRAARLEERHKRNAAIEHMKNLQESYLPNQSGAFRQRELLNFFNRTAS